MTSSLVLQRKLNLWLLGNGSLPAQLRCCRSLLSPCRCQKPHGDMAVVRVGDAFSARVQHIVLIACRKLFPLYARTLLNVHQGVQHKVDCTIQATANCHRNTAGNTLPSGHVQRATSFHPYFFRQLLCSILWLDSDHAHTFLASRVL